jgi:CBS-domain-containing membrane protein
MIARPAPMKIAFFLTPKADVAWLSTTSTMRQAIERMEHRRFTAVPLLDPEGRYDSTLTEGDLLWFFKQHPEMRFADSEHVTLTMVKRRVTVRPVEIDAEIEGLFNLALDQNFVPVVDGRAVFIGIVRRRTILEFFEARMIAEGHKGSERPG